MPKVRRKRLTKNMIKQVSLAFKRNINLLDKPLFIPSRTRVEEGQYADGKGYEIKCRGGLPVSYDIDVLNFLMHKAQLAHNVELKFKTMRDLLEGLGYSDGKCNYEMVGRSLDKWSKTRLSFRGLTFYVGSGERVNINNLSILTWEKGSNKSVVIRFDDYFFELNLKTYSRHFPIKLMAQMTPFSKRIFELLRKNDKNLNNYSIYKIGFDKLGLKIPTSPEMPTSKLLWYLKKSADEINSILPRFGIKDCYAIGRDPKNKNNVIIRKVPSLIWEMILEFPENRNTGVTKALPTWIWEKPIPREE